MNNLHLPLLPGKVYHLFNHAVGSENLFQEDANYSYFLEKYRKYAAPVCRTFSYALLPNHFHFLVQVRSIPELVLVMPGSGPTTAPETFAEFVMQQFSNLCNAYAKAYNKRYNRRGALFIDFLRRKPVESSVYFEHVVLYHHFNQVYHDFCASPIEYRFTSYSSFLNNRESLLERETVIRRFGGKEQFIARHQGYDWRFDEDLEF
jgi:REP element-mobilizing transposase RayT